MPSRKDTPTNTTERHEKTMPTGIVHDAFARFFQNPTLPTLRELLRDNVGELNSIDFKAEWPDAPVLAKHLLAIGNHGGGCMVVGVEEQTDGTFSPKGLGELKDAAMVFQQIKKFIPASLLDEITVLPFVYKEAEYEAIKGKAFQVVFVNSDIDHGPFVSQAEGTGIKDATIYVRRGTASEPANHQELQKLLNARIATKYSTAREISLSEHLEQLKLLYKEVPKNLARPSSNLLSTLEVFRTIGSLGGNLESVENPHYPKEGYNEFLAECIRKKKLRIESELDI